MTRTKHTLPPIKERIRAALLGQPLQELDYHALMDQVFPREHFPRAGRYQANGGPPGCAMALGKALREMADAAMVYDYGGLGRRRIRLRSDLPLR